MTVRSKLFACGLTTPGGVRTPIVQPAAGMTALIRDVQLLNVSGGPCDWGLGVRKGSDAGAEAPWLLYAEAVPYLQAARFTGLAWVIPAGYALVLYAAKAGASSVGVHHVVSGTLLTGVAA